MFGRNIRNLLDLMISHTKRKTLYPDFPMQGKFKEGERVQARFYANGQPRKSNFWKRNVEVCIRLNWIVEKFGYGTLFNL